MALDFYYGSGSPYAWRVWLALEHKALPYRLQTLSFDGGDLKSPHFTALNPRQRVPVLVDQDLALYESAAIVEYLEDAYPGSGAPLFPATPKARATVRRIVREADEYLAHAMEEMVVQILFTKRDQWQAEAIAKGRDAFAKEISHFERQLTGDFFADQAGAADFTLYPMVALVLRMEKRKPDLDMLASIGPRLTGWMKRVEALPCCRKTWPPHWK